MWRDNPEILGKCWRARTVLTDRKFPTKMSGIFFIYGKQPVSLARARERYFAATDQNTTSIVTVWMINKTVYFIRNTFVVGKQKCPFWEK